MKKRVSILSLFLLFLFACANTNSNQIPESLSSSYDGIWDGYAEPFAHALNSERQYIKAEIKNGIVSGSIGDSKLNGYITSDNNLIINPVYVYVGASVASFQPPDKIIIETILMSPNRIEGTLHTDRFTQTPKYDWYLVKPATGKPDN